ncbi:hypothetical protein O0L34_g10731 [Tuta absoluta]|nr:hypothetical protein O0L34_g10731 [Tuta absoluta]
MDETFKDPVPLSQGINLRDVMTQGSEFQIDMDFKKKPSAMLNADEDFYPDLGDEDDSDSDVLNLIEESTGRKMLASPEYHSFDELAKKMIDCEPGGRVKIIILEEGDGPLVPVDAEVTFHYAGYWEKASIPFDSSLTMNQGRPVTQRLGVGSLIPGIELGLTTVKGPTAHFMLLVQPEAGWGRIGALPRIKPEPSLFIVKLYDVRDVHAAVRFNDLPREEQTKFQTTLCTVKSIHDDAKILFSKRKYEKAIKNYQQSVHVLNLSQPETSNEEQDVKKLKISAFLNLAVCYSKINKPKSVIRMLESLDYVTDIDKNCKALFYYGKAYEMLGKTDLAIEYYQKALKLEPKNAAIGKALEKLDHYLKTSAKNEKVMWQSVFKSDKKDDIIVDDDFKEGVRDLFKDLASNNEYAKFDLPPTLNSRELEYVKSLAKQFEGIVVLEDGEAKRKKFTVVKKS